METAQVTLAPAAYCDTDFQVLSEMISLGMELGGGSQAAMPAMLEAYQRVLKAKGVVAWRDKHFYNLLLRISVNSGGSWPDKLQQERDACLKGADGVAAAQHVTAQTRSASMASKQLPMVQPRNASAGSGHLPIVQPRTASTAPKHLPIVRTPSAGSGHLPIVQSRTASTASKHLPIVQPRNASAPSAGQLPIVQPSTAPGRLEARSEQELGGVSEPNETALQRQRQAEEFQRLRASYVCFLSASKRRQQTRLLLQWRARTAHRQRLRQARLRVLWRDWRRAVERQRSLQRQAHTVLTLRKDLALQNFFAHWRAATRQREAVHTLSHLLQAKRTRKALQPFELWREQTRLRQAEKNVELRLMVEAFSCWSGAFRERQALAKLEDFQAKQAMWRMHVSWTSWRVLARQRRADQVGSVVESTKRLRMLQSGWTAWETALARRRTLDQRAEAVLKLREQFALQRSLAGWRRAARRQHDQSEAAVKRHEVVVLRRCYSSWRAVTRRRQTEKVALERRQVLQQRAEAVLKLREELALQRSLAGWRRATRRQQAERSLSRLLQTRQERNTLLVLQRWKEQLLLRRACRNAEFGLTSRAFHCWRDALLGKHTWSKAAAFQAERSERSLHVLWTSWRCLARQHQADRACSVLQRTKRARSLQNGWGAWQTALRRKQLLDQAQAAVKRHEDVVLRQCFVKWRTATRQREAGHTLSHVLQAKRSRKALQLCELWREQTRLRQANKNVELRLMVEAFSCWAGAFRERQALAKLEDFQAKQAMWRMHVSWTSWRALARQRQADQVGSVIESAKSLQMLRSGWTAWREQTRLRQAEKNVELRLMVEAFRCWSGAFRERQALAKLEDFQAKQAMWRMHVSWTSWRVLARQRRADQVGSVVESTKRLRMLQSGWTAWETALARRRTLDQRAEAVLKLRKEFALQRSLAGWRRAARRQQAERTLSQLVQTRTLQHLQHWRWLTQARLALHALREKDLMRRWEAHVLSRHAAKSQALFFVAWWHRARLLQPRTTSQRASTTHIECSQRLLASQTFLRWRCNARLNQMCAKLRKRQLFNRWRRRAAALVRSAATRKLQEQFSHDHAVRRRGQLLVQWLQLSRQQTHLWQTWQARQRRCLFRRWQRTAADHLHSRLTMEKHRLRLLRHVFVTWRRRAEITSSPYIHSGMSFIASGHVSISSPDWSFPFPNISAAKIGAPFPRAPPATAPAPLMLRASRSEPPATVPTSAEVTDGLSGEAAGTANEAKGEEEEEEERMEAPHTTSVVEPRVLFHVRRATRLHVADSTPRAPSTLGRAQALAALERSVPRLPDAPNTQLRAGGSEQQWGSTSRRPGTAPSTPNNSQFKYDPF